MRRETVSIVMSVCPSDYNNWAPSGRILNKLDFWVSVEGILISLKSAKNNGHFMWRHTDINGNIWLSYFWNEKCFRKNCIKIKTHFNFKNFFFRKKSCHFWDNANSIVEPDRLQMTIWRMRIACWIAKARNTHRDCVKVIAFPPQKWIHERAAILRYTYVACLDRINWDESKKRQK